VEVRKDKNLLSYVELNTRFSHNALGHSPYQMSYPSSQRLRI